MRVFLWLLFAGFSTALANAQEPPAPEAPHEEPLSEIVVSGEFPGPGLWKVTRAGETSGHALWIVGDPGPLPKGMKWKSQEIEAKVASAQEVLFDAGINLTPDEKVGVFRGLTLVPAALKARRNPDDGKLADVLPAELYARWQVQKKLYLGRDRGVESWRPLFAAQKLQEGVVEKLGLSPRETVYRKVRDLAGKRKIKQTSPTIKYTFKRSELRDRIKEFSREALADVECLAVTLDLVEALGRRDVENARNKAWARGDLAGLSALPMRPNPNLPCAMAIMNAEAARDLVPANIQELVTAKWLEAVEASLAANQTTFAVLSYDKLIRKDGYLDLLRQKGYVVEDPS
jgi:TraB/PrgY/gumN family